MKLVKYFDAFLENTVNLNPSRMDLLDTRSTAITKFLKADEVFGLLLKTTIPQGSFAQRTIIRPQSDTGTFDADILVHLDPVPNWAPSEFVGKLYTALGRSSIYKDMRHRRTRCVYIDYADEFHVDLVPYVERDGGGWITNNKTNQFEFTDPKGFTGWLKDQHRTTDGNLIKVIRLLKFVRDTTWFGNPKSVILTTLVGERIAKTRKLFTPGCYADVPTTLKTVVDDLDDYVQQRSNLPPIIDPGGTGDRFDQRWDQQGYTLFRARCHSMRLKVDEAFDEDSVDASVQAWRAIFGPTFRAPATTKSATRGAIVLSEGRALPVTERFLDRDYGIPFVSTPHKVHMDGWVKRKDGFRHYWLSQERNKVGKWRTIQFRIESCTVPEPYTVFWKVRNTGAEADQAGALRGEISMGGALREESTAYSGAHWVECYIVKDDRCVAWARRAVNIP